MERAYPHTTQQRPVIDQRPSDATAGKLRTERTVRMRPSAHAALLIGIAVGLSFGCGMPVRVTRITDAKTPVAGIRYLLRRPSYAVSLRVKDPGGPAIADLRQFGVFAGSPLPQPGEAAAVWACSHPDKGNCVDPPAATPYCVTTGSKVIVLVTQEMDGPPLLFEARSPEGLAALGQAFANSDFTLTLDEGTGALAGFNTSVTDKTLEIIQSASSLAISAATMAAADASPENKTPPPDAVSCVLINDVSFTDYVDAHRSLIARRDLLQSTLEQTVRKLPTQNPSDLNDATSAIAALKNEIDSAKDRLKAVSYEVDESHYRIAFDNASTDERGVATPAPTPVPTNVWFSIKLKQLPQPPTPTPPR